MEEYIGYKEYQQYMKQKKKEEGNRKHGQEERSKGRTVYDETTIYEMDEDCYECIKRKYKK